MIKNKLIGIILLFSIIVIYIIDPYFGDITKEMYNVAKYAVAVFGIWASLRLIFR